MEQTSKPRLAVCRQLAGGNANAGELLYRIAFWRPLAWNKGDGRQWIANDRAWWARQTGQSTDQIKRALSLLRRKGLIETRQGLWQNRNILHVLYTEQVAQALLPQPPAQENTVPLKEGDGPPPRQSTHAPAEGSNNAPLHIVQGDTTGIKQQGDSCVQSHANGDQNVKIRVPGKTKEVLPPAGKTVAEVIATAPKPAPPTKQVAVGSLAAAWRAAVIEHYDCYVAPLTHLQMGQLKHFRNACPPGAGTAELVISCVVGSWGDFAAIAATDVDLASEPPRPSIGFLLKCVGTAVNFWLHEQKKADDEAAKAKKPPVPVQSIAIVAAVEEKASLADVLAIFGTK